MRGVLIISRPILTPIVDYSRNARTGRALTLKFTEHRFLLDVTRGLEGTFRKSHRIRKSVAALYRILRLLFFHRTNELGIRRSRDDAIELGSVVVDHADILDHQVVNFPFLVDAMEFVVDR